MMQVHVKLFASLRRFTGNTPLGTPLDVDVPEGATLTELYQTLHLPVEEIKLAYINGRVQPDDRQLQPGDEIGIFPPVGGG
jgi:molybdopterin converting factor small subunit